jgi:hypothetical protein
MVISGKILNSLNGQPLYGAKISVYRKNGTSALLGKTDVQGNYNVVASDSVQCLLIEKDNFTPTLVSPGELQEAGGINVSPANVVTGAGAQPTNMPSAPAAGAASSNPVAQTLSTIPAVAWIAGGLTLAAMSVGAKKKIGDINYTPFILIGALGIGAYFLYEAFFGGTSANSANNNAITQNTTAANASTLAQSQAVVPQTLSQSQVNAIATDIYNQGQTGNAATNMLASDAAQQQIHDDLMQINNATDWYAIVSAFGAKTSCVFASTGCQNYDLASWIKALCAPAVVAEINQDVFANLSINYSL